MSGQPISCRVLDPEIALEDSDTEAGSSQSPSKGEDLSALVRQHHPGPNYMISPTEGLLYRIQCHQNKSTKVSGPYSILYCPSPYVSKSHCELFWRDGMYWIKDLGSTNGTYVNGKRLVRHRVTRLRHGDMVAVAGVYTEDDLLTNVKDDKCFVFIFHKVDPQVSPHVGDQEPEQLEPEVTESHADDNLYQPSPGEEDYRTEDIRR